MLKILKILLSKIEKINFGKMEKSPSNLDPETYKQLLDYGFTKHAILQRAKMKLEDNNKDLIDCCSIYQAKYE